jgi:hypothetical protein
MPSEIIDVAFIDGTRHDLPFVHKGAYNGWAAAACISVRTCLQREKRVGRGG